MLIEAMVFAAQLAAESDMLMTYVPAEAVGQTPCAVAASPPEHPHRLPNGWLFGSLMLRTEKGTSGCLFHQVGAGHCTFASPGHLVVEFDDKTTVYDIPDGSSVEFEFRHERFACRIGQRIRTHGDTIVPILSPYRERR